MVDVKEGMKSKSTDWSNLRPDGTPFRDGLDDGPPLPSPAALERARRAIEVNRLITDAERINWIEKTKYIQTGIRHDGKAFAFEVRFHEHGNLKRFFGRSLRGAIDQAIRAEEA